MSQSKEVCAENLAHVLRRNHISFPAFVLEIPVKLIILLLIFQLLARWSSSAHLRAIFFSVFVATVCVLRFLFKKILSNSIWFWRTDVLKFSVVRLSVGDRFCLHLFYIEERETLCWKFICRIKTTRISVRQFVVSCSGGLDMFLWLNFLDDMRLHISSALFLHALRCFACSCALKNAAVYGIRARMILK